MSRRVIENKESARLLKLNQELSSLKAEIRNYVPKEWYPVTENGNRRSEESIREAVNAYCKKYKFSLSEFREKVTTYLDMSRYDLPMDDFEEFMNGHTNSLAYLRCAEYLDLKTSFDLPIMTIMIKTRCKPEGEDSVKLKQLKRDLADYKEKRFCSLIKQWYPSNNGKRRTPKSIRKSVMNYCKNNAISILDFREKVMNDEEDMSSCELPLSGFTKFMSGYYGTEDSDYAYSRCGEYLALENIRSKIRSVKQQDEWKKRKREDVNDENEDPRKISKRSKLANITRVEAEAKALVDKIVAVPMKYDAATIPIFEDCEVIRKKVNNFLFTTPGLTVDYLMKAIGCKPRLWAAFNSSRGRKGWGASSRVYGAAYRFFEQLRILEKLPKSQNRLIQEKRWASNITEWAPNGGYDRKSQEVLPTKLVPDNDGGWCISYDVHIDIDDERDKDLEREKKEKQERRKRELETLMYWRSEFE